MTSTETVTVSRASPRPLYRTGGRVWLAIALWILGVGAAAVALLGPLVFGVIDYHVSERAVNQIIGGDVAGLFLVAAVAIIAGILVWRTHPGGPVLALGPAVYGLYMYSQLAVGGDVSRYPGNSELFFPLFMGLFILAGGIAIGVWRTIDASDLPGTSRGVDRFFGWFAGVVAVFLTVGLHIPGLVMVWSGDPGSEYLADPVVFWLVKFMDLGLVVPALVAIGIGVLRSFDWAAKAKYAAVGWVALLGSSVAGMAIVMQMTADPAATVANTIAFSLFALVGLATAVVIYRPLFVADRPSRTQGGES